MTRPVRSALPLLATLLAGAALPASAAAQSPLQRVEPAADSVHVVLAGASDVALDRRIKRLLGAHPTILTSDGSLPAGDTLAGPVLVLDATLVLEGVVTGDLVIIDGGAFVRPGSRVRGDLVNIAGGLYRSELARVDGRILDYPNAHYRVIREPEEDRIVIQASATPSPLSLDGYMGLHTPSYDRVNGVTAIWGARYRFPLIGNVTPSVHAQGGWMTQRGEPEYEVDVAARWIGTRISAGYEHGWATNDTWIRTDLDNSLHYLWNANDYRDYNAVDRRWGRIDRELGDVAKSFYAILSVTGQVEDASSLAGGQPWSIWGDSARSNPPVDDGRITSGVATVELEWRGQQTWFNGHFEYEAAREVRGGDFTFDRASAHGVWAMHALFHHTLEIEAYAQVPLRGAPLPRQRWSFVGGSGTLQTLPIAAQQGDHIVFVETRYVIPFPQSVALPVLGAPDLALLHATGSAWTADGDPDFQQEVGARLQFFGPYVRYMVQPRGLDHGALDVGVTWPFGAERPWER